MKQNSTPTTTQTAFDDVLHLIDSAKQRVYRAANTELIDLYWQVGELISKKIASAEWGDGVVAQLADFIAQTQPNLRGFTQRNLFRMRQFYEAYQGDTKVSPLVTQLSWTHNLTILSRSKRPEEREFYLEALDQDHRKPHENPAIGVLLCASKDDEVVEYALNRSLSPALIAEYVTQLPDKQLLQAKLHEFYVQNMPQGEQA